MNRRALRVLLPWHLVVSCCLWATPPAAGQPIDVLTFDGTRTLNPFATSAGYSQVRSSLLNPANFGPGGVVPRPVQSITAVPTITASSLSGIEVVVLASVGSLPTAAETSALSTYVNGGGALLIADNNAALILQSILGVTPAGSLRAVRLL
jgi:hypothetical protein